MDDKKPKKSLGGRPTTYTEELAQKICDLTACNTLSYRNIEKLHDDLPVESTVRLWRLKNPAFSVKYAQAKLAQAELLAEECLEIADEGRNDWMESLSDEEKGDGWRLNGEHINRSRLRIDTRKFFASKLLPKKYGDFVGQNLESNNKDLHDESMKRSEVLEKEY